MRVLQGLAAAAAFFFTLAGPAPAQTFPSKTVRLIVPSTPGGSTDIAARAIAPKLQAELGQSVIVENKPGGGSMIGTRNLLQAPPDGHTLLVSFPSMLTASLAYKSPGYSMSQLVSVGPVFAQDFILWINSRNVPARTLGEFVAYAKRNPGKLNAVSFGPAGITSLAFERFKHTGGFEVTGIPYAGTSAGLVALLAGSVDVCLACATTGQAMGMQDKGLLPLAIAGPKRSPQAPHIPTFKELGYPSMVVPGWTGVFAPSAAPPEVLKRLREAMARVMADPEVRKQLVSAGLDPWEGSVADFNAQVERETREWADDIRRIGLQLD